MFMRLVLGGIYWLLRLSWFIRRPRSFGAHALALTSAGGVILVRLRYAPGWRLPGGGRGAGEDARAAALRELREEIGMTAHGSVTLACEFEEVTDFRHDFSTLLIVRDVSYAPPRWSWEIEAVTEAPLDALPADLSPRMARWLEALKPNL
jgi:8-oxo-dGTP pyrophosphatase MutT (NUDIX family)